LHPGRPTIQGFVALFDHHTGQPLALVAGPAITALRTGAASGLATRLLARPDAASLGLFGSGVQASSHLEAICAVRNITQVRVWGRSWEHPRAFAERHSGRFKVKLVAVTEPRDAAACDIVCTTTAAKEPEFAFNGCGWSLLGEYGGTG
jgi:ornithine cyclodeaminase